MKYEKIILVFIVAVVVAVACSKKNAAPDTPVNKSKGNNFSQYATMGIDSPFIPVDTANVMLTSYQASIGSDDVKSFVIDADALRYYLGNNDIKHMKIMLAHKLSYIRGGNAGQPVGYGANGLTIIISGYDDDNNYIYTPQGTVLDYASPYLPMLSNRGNAVEDQLPQAE